MAKCWLALLALTGAAVPVAQAQEFSADGNRWYEVEVSIFAIELPRAPDGEQPVPANTRMEIRLGLPPAGYKYVRVASDILMIAVGTRMVVDAINDLGRL